MSRPRRLRVKPFLPLCDSFGAAGKSLSYSGLRGFLCRMTRPDWSTDMTDSLSQQEAEVRVMDAWLGWAGSPRSEPCQKRGGRAWPHKRNSSWWPLPKQEAMNRECQGGGKKPWWGEVRTGRKIRSTGLWSPLSRRRTNIQLTHSFISEMLEQKVIRYWAPGEPMPGQDKDRVQAYILVSALYLVHSSDSPGYPDGPSISQTVCQTLQPPTPLPERGSH